MKKYEKYCRNVIIIIVTITDTIVVGFSPHKFNSDNKNKVKKSLSFLFLIYNNKR